MNTRNTLALLATVLLSACGSNNANTITNPNPGGLGAGGCVPINTQIGFTGTNNEFSYTQLQAGVVPPTTFGFGGTHGTLNVGGGAAGGPYQSTGVDGTISLNVVPMGGAGIPGTGAQLVNTNGIVSISSITQSDILYYFTGSNQGGFPGGFGQQPGIQPVCVSGIAIDIGHYGNILHSGNVYLYLTVNGQPGQPGMQGYALYF